MNLVGQAVNENLENDAHLTFFTSSLPKIRWAMADESDDKTEENFKDKEEFDSRWKEYKCRKIEMSEMFSQFYCKLCNVISQSQVSLSVHRAGKKHKENLKRAQRFPQFYCKLCEVQSTSRVDLNIHRAGQNHQRNLKITNLAEKNSKNFHLDPEVLCHKLINRSRKNIKKIGRRLLKIKNTALLLN